MKTLTILLLALAIVTAGAPRIALADEAKAETVATAASSCQKCATCATCREYVEKGRHHQHANHHHHHHHHHAHHAGHTHDVPIYRNLPPGNNHLPPTAYMAPWPSKSE